MALGISQTSITMETGSIANSLCVVVSQQFMCSDLLLAHCVSVYSKSTGLHAQSTELQSTQGLALQRQTLVEQVIYPTCQHNRCSSRVFQCFSSSRCLLSYVVTHRQKPEGSMTIISTAINTGSQQDIALMCSTQFYVSDYT